MPGKRPSEIVSYNMSQIRSQGTQLEAKLEEILKSLPYKYSKHPDVYGKPDFAFPEAKIVVFADSDFWHGFDWAKKKMELKTNKEFWLKKIERNIARDAEVTNHLEEDGWKVIRLWGHDILKKPDECKALLEKTMKAKEQVN